MSFAPVIARVSGVEIRPLNLSNAFVRGDANADGAVDLSDGVYILGYLFTGGPTPSCLDAADVDDSAGTDSGYDINISDSIYLLNFLFLGGPVPPDPHEACGADPTGDEVSCESFTGCP